MSTTPALDTTPEPDPVHETDDVAALRSEAANRRRQLRAEEAKSAALAARLEVRDREDVERLAAERFADPADLWLSTSLDAMRGDDGSIDKEKAAAEVERVLAEKPHWRATRMHPNLHGGARETAETPKSPSFGQTIKNALTGG